MLASSSFSPGGYSARVRRKHEQTHTNTYIYTRSHTRIPTSTRVRRTKGNEQRGSIVVKKFPQSNNVEKKARACNDVLIIKLMASMQRLDILLVLAY
jgi:phage terminase large subunit GpA-like protein